MVAKKHEQESCTDVVGIGSDLEFVPAISTLPMEI